MKFIVSLTFFILIGPLSLIGVKYPIINYQTSDGLPQNQINALIQGEWGNILVGTQSGMGRFDGNQFEVFTSKNGLINNFITDFALDNNQHLWIATQGGLTEIDEKNNAIANYPFLEPISAISWEESSKCLWIITARDVYYLNENEKSFQKYGICHNLNIKDVLISTMAARFFYSDSEIIVEKGKKTTRIKSKETINVLKTIVNNNKEQLLAGTANGLFILDNIEPFQWIKYIALPPGFRNVNDVVEDNAGNLWLGTTGGLLFYNQKENNTLSITKENGLVNNNITKIFIDKEKNIFAGTRWGMSQLSLDLFKMYDIADGLPHEFIWCFIEDEDYNSILIGCENGIVELKKDGTVQCLNINNRLKENSIRTIVKMGPNDYLFGTRNHGIYRWNRIEKLEKIYPNVHVLSALKVKENNNDIIWWGTDNGLLRHDLKNKTFENLKEGLNDKNIWSLALYNGEELLVGTEKGIQKLYNGKFVPFQLETIIGDATVNDIKVVSKNEILVATQLNGLYICRKDQNEKEFNAVHLTTANGLSHNDVWSVIKDQTDNIWFNTSISLDRYYKGFISHFNKKAGLFGNEGALHASFKDKNGKVYLGIVPGFVEISPRSESINITPPILYIKQIIIDENEKSKKTIGAAFNGEITLPYRQNNAEFHYIAVSTRKENPVFYRYRLFPFEKKWSEPTRLTFVSYMNLPPDRYIFEVEANNGGEEAPWIKSQNTIKLIIEKPFWLTWWFICVSILSAFGLIVMFTKIRLRALENQKKYLEKLVKQRTEELARLSITDPLTDLKNRRYLEEKIKEDISLIERAIYDRVKIPFKNHQIPFHLLGIFILDIDHFKKVNDIYGHKAGDIVIVDIARLLLDMLRNSDTIIRWGGEEFLIITHQTEMDSSLELAERIRKRIAEYPFKINDTLTINKTVSIGFAHFPFIANDTRTFHWTQVISLADSALYIAKNNGRNLTVGLKTGQKSLDMDAKEIISNIKMGIDKNYIELVCMKKNLKTPQPKS